MKLVKILCLLLCLALLSGCGPASAPADDPSDSTGSSESTGAGESTGTTETTGAADDSDTLKILAIGGSFSIDAMEYLYQIAQDGGVKKIVLKRNTEHCVKLVLWNRSDIATAYSDASRINVVKAHKQAYHCGFSRARRADYSESFSSSEGKAYILKIVFLTVIGEAYVIENNVSVLVNRRKIVR